MFETEEGQLMASACIEYGGWDHKKQTLTPIKLAELLARKMCELSAMSCEKLAATGGSQTVTIMFFGS
jgi:hypothetical protein